MFFDNWTGIWRTPIIGIIAYISLVVLLRISGKRTLSKMNAFDLVVTIAIGSTLATIMLSKTVALSEGILALALLIFLQYIITWLSVRSKFISRLVKSEPQLVFRNGKFLEEALKKERLMKDEILQALRNEGIDSLEEVRAVILETDGSLSVISSSKEKVTTTENVSTDKSKDDKYAGRIKLSDLLRM